MATANGTARTCRACATCGWASTSTRPSIQLLSYAISKAPRVARTSCDSGDLGDQQIKITGLLFDKAKNSLVKFSGVISIPGIGPAASGFGLPSELKSTARPKLGGRVIYFAPISTPESRLKGRTSSI